LVRIEVALRDFGQSCGKGILACQEKLLSGKHFLLRKREAGKKAFY
jgi:hypothetical protein